jgi:hypothetical protein
MMTHIYADLLHGLYGQGIQASGMRTGTFGIDVIAGNPSHQRFGHLTARRVSGAQKKNSLFHGSGATTWSTTRSVVSQRLGCPNEGAYELTIDERSDGLNIRSRSLEKFLSIFGRINPGWF